MADTTVTTTSSADSHRVTYGQFLVWTSPSVGYFVFIDSGSDIMYQKTTDSGATWGTPVTVKSAAMGCYAIWFDKWTPSDTGTKIHMVYADSTSDDLFYRDLETASDTLGTERTVFASTSLNATATTLNQKCVGITKTRSGRLCIGFVDDLTSVEEIFYTSDDAGATWDVRAIFTEGVVDLFLMFPGNLADPDDMWVLFKDLSGSEISLKTYDASLDSWSEASIVASITASTDFMQMDGVIRHSDGHLLVAALNAIDTATSDLLTWDITNAGTITAKANILTDTDDVGAVSLLINQQNSDVYAAIIGAAAETWNTAVTVWKDVSTDDLTSWGGVAAYSEATASSNRIVSAGHSVGSLGGRFQPLWFDATPDDHFVNLVNDVEIAAASGSPTGNMITSKVLRSLTQGRVF